MEKFYNDVKKYGISLFINNVGFGDMNLLWNSDLDKIRDNLDKDVQLINVSSVAGYGVFSRAINYSASKIFVDSWTEDNTIFI